MRDAEQSDQFPLIMPESPHAGFHAVHMVQRPAQKVMQTWFGMLRLHGGFQQLATICRKQGSPVVSSQALAPLADGNLPQRVQFTPSPPLEHDFTLEKQIQLSRERTFRPPRALGHRLDQPLILAEPMHDEAAVRQPGKADDRGPCRLHAASLVDPPRMAILFPPVRIRRKLWNFRSVSRQFVGITHQKQTILRMGEKILKNIHKMD
jgi:hypothetical protein